MAKRRHDEDVGGYDRVFDQLAAAPVALHEVAPPAATLPSGLPEPLIELYARCDGGRLFGERIVLRAAREVATPTPGRWQFAAIDGDEVALDHRGRVWRRDGAIDDDVLEGTRLDRWLSGAVDATAVLYARSGAVVEAAFDADGEIRPEILERQRRLQLKRDAAAPGPRWRLALALLAQDRSDEARDELEQVVADHPAFAWAWLYLAHISEQAGELAGAIDEVRMGAETAEGARHPQAGAFWARVARLAARTGDEMLRAEAATRSSLLSPTLKREQIEAVEQSIADGDPAGARDLLELLTAVWPRDAEVDDLVRQADALPAT